MSITTLAAAELIGCDNAGVLLMVERGGLRVTGDSDRPVRLVDAMIEFGRRHKRRPGRPARRHPARASQLSPIPAPVPRAK